MLQTRCNSVVLPAFDLPITRILNRPIRSKCSLTCAGSRRKSSSKPGETIATCAVSKWSVSSVPGETVVPCAGPTMICPFSQRDGWGLCRIVLTNPIYKRLRLYYAVDKFGYCLPGLFLRGRVDTSTPKHPGTILRIIESLWICTRGWFKETELVSGRGRVVSATWGSALCQSAYHTIRRPHALIPSNSCSYCSNSTSFFRAM